MKADDWRKSCGEDDAILSACIDDLAESEREADILRDALAESERLRVEAEAKVAELEEMALHRSYSRIDEERAKWDAVKAYEDAAQELHEEQAKVTALTDILAQSSTQYREMVRVLTDARGMALRHYTEDDCQECGALLGSIDAVLGRSTP